ncbi:MAG: hypothetical protein ACP5NV_06590 [Candidatus Woesearchaeota archaeon]
MDKNTAQTVVKVIGILGIIGAAIGLLVGLILMILGPAAMGFLIQEMGALSGLVGGALILAGVFIILFSIFGLFVSINLMKYKEWARIVVIIFAALGILNGLFSLPVGLVGIIINGLVIYLLAFNKDVIKLFK